MKATIFLIVASLLSVRLLAQDTLYTKTGSVLNGKVVEIDQDKIKYKKASNPDGPMYTINKSDIVLIHFKNGSKEVFSSNSNSVQDNSSTQNNSGGNNVPAVVNNNYTGNSGYGYGRPGVNVVVGAVPYYGLFNRWGWGGYGGYYRPYYHGGYYGGGFHHYGGGYHGGGHYGHHR